MIHSARVRSFLAFFLCLVVLSASFCVSASASNNYLFAFDIPEHSYEFDIGDFRFTYFNNTDSTPSTEYYTLGSNKYKLVTCNVPTNQIPSHNPIIGEYVQLESANVDFIRNLVPGDTIKYTGSLIVPRAFSEFAPDYFYVDAGFVMGDGSVSIVTIYSIKDFTSMINKFYQFTSNITIPDNSVSMSLIYRFGVNDGSKRSYCLGFQNSYLYLTGDTLNRVVEQGKLDDIIGNDESEESASGIKGVILWIKNLPEKISLKLREMFVPSEDSITSFKTKMQTLLSSRLGVLWEIPDFIVTTFKLIISFKPNETHKIDFPAFKFNMSKSGEFSQGTSSDGYNFDFWSKQTINFDFLDDYPYSILYTGYKMSVTCILLSALIALAVRKGNEILGGD